MPISPPVAAMLDQPDVALMELFGRMRSLTDEANFSGVLPVVWQCSDESQKIKNSLFGYVYDCPVFNLGRVGALMDPARLIPASHHGHDLVILGGSHLGNIEEDGVGYVERVHGKVAPCCGMLHRLMGPYLTLYRRASTLITLFRGPGGLKIEIPYKYLLRKETDEHEHAHLHLRMDRLVDGEALRDASQGKVYRLNPEMAKHYQHSLEYITTEPVPIGKLLDSSSFFYSKRLDRGSYNPDVLLESSVFDFMPDIVTSDYPHRRLADVNTWRQFHRLAAYLADSFDSGERNIFVVAGLTLDHTIKRNSFIPQFGFWMRQGRALQARYYNAPEINALLNEQTVFAPDKTFLQYAEID
ncbi:MAG: hypothetical protein OET90_07245 [Desulfuromonadales bacterium]|nr:hypothetical protein [Desulfuromonadales bacterium]